MRLGSRVWGESAAVVLVAAVLIAVVTWPWAADLAGRLSSHWDVGLHAWKLNWNAEHILSGRFWLPPYHGNFFYPQAYALALDDLFWVPSFFAAVVRGLSGNAVLTYNATFLFFWALSGGFMFLLLRELGLGRAAAWLGGLAFCLLPYRASYYLEINGQFCFGIPLLLWLLARFFKEPGYLNGILAALAFWAQAVSALYYAAILAVSLPLILVPLMRGRADLFKERRFYAVVGVVLVVLVGLCAAYLYPYYLLHTRMGFSRSLGEMARHSAQPLTYLMPASSFVPPYGLARILPLPPALKAEVILWPGLALVLLALVYGFRGRRLLRRRQEAASSGIPAASGWTAGLRWLRLCGLVGFASWVCWAAWRGPGLLPAWAGNLLVNGCLLAVLLASLALSLLEPAVEIRRGFIMGLATAAFFCFALSLGPRITVGNRELLANNDVMLFFFNYVPLGHSTRVMSRYGIMPLFALVVSAALAFDGLGSRPLWRGVFWCLLVGLMVWEADIPITAAYVPPRLNSDPAFQRVLSNHEPCSIIVLPLGERKLDSDYMLWVSGTHHQRYLINGWTGFGHPYTHELGQLFGRGRMRRALAELEYCWPDALIVVDRQALRYYNRKGYATTEDKLDSWSNLIYRDDKFCVYRPWPVARVHHKYTRMVRIDLLTRAKAVCFSIRSRKPYRLTRRAGVYLNGVLLGKVEVKSRWRRHRIEIKKAPLFIHGDNITIQPLDTREGVFEIKDFCLLLPRDSGRSRDLSPASR